MNSFKIAVSTGNETRLLFLWLQIKEVIVIMSFKAQTTIINLIINDVKIISISLV